MDKQHLTAAIARVYNLIAELAHPMDGCEENVIEDEAHDLLAEVRVAYEQQAQEIDTLTRSRDGWIADASRGLRNNADQVQEIARLTALAATRKAALIDALTLVKDGLVDQLLALQHRLAAALTEERKHLSYSSLRIDKETGNVGIGSIHNLAPTIPERAIADREAPPWLRIVLGGEREISKIEIVGPDGRVVILTPEQIMAALAEEP